MTPNEYPPKFSGIDLAKLSKKFKDSSVGKKLITIIGKSKKKTKSLNIIQDITVDFRNSYEQALYKESVQLNNPLN